MFSFSTPRTTALILALTLFTNCLLARAQGRPKAFTGAKIIPINSDPIENGTFIIQDHKILAVGPANTLIPPDSERIDVTGKVIMPGLVDTHSHIGGPAGADGSSPIQPETRVLDSIDVRDASLQKAQAGGITTVNIMPGSGHLVSGQTLYLKLRDANSIEDLLITNKLGRIAGGLKMANGTNPRRDPPFPGTRGKAASLVREKLVAAREYRDKINRAKGDVDKLPPRDLALEVFVEALDGSRMVHHHTHRHDDILTVLRLQKEFGFRVVLHHVSDAWKVAREIAEAKALCSIIVLDSPGGKLEARDVDWSNGVALEKAGAQVAFHTDDSVTDSRWFLRSAAFAVRAGMSRAAALKGLTITAAEMLDLHEQIGSLAPGKDADFLILSGDPLSAYSQVMETWVDGVRVFDRSNAKDRLWAVGGLGAGQSRSAHLCCFGTWDTAR